MIIGAVITIVGVIIGAAIGTMQSNKDKDV